MKANKSEHLNEDQLVIAVVDQNDLPEKVLSHFEKCSVCQIKVNTFENQLSEFKIETDANLPDFEKSIKLPKTKIKNFSLNYKLIGVVAAALFLFAISWNEIHLTVNEPATLEIASNNQNTFELNAFQISDENLYNQENFMQEVSLLSDNALPEDFLLIQGEIDVAQDELN